MVLVKRTNRDATRVVDYHRYIIPENPTSPTPTDPTRTCAVLFEGGNVDFFIVRAAPIQEMRVSFMAFMECNVCGALYPWLTGSQTAVVCDLQMRGFMF